MRDQRVVGRPLPGSMHWLTAPRDIRCSRAASIRSLLRWPWKRALICFLHNPSGEALRASRIRSAVRSPVQVPKRREALAEQYSHTARAAWRWGRRDDGTAVKSCVDGAEAQDLGFGAAGGGAVEAWTSLAQGGVAIVPKLSRGFIAAKKDLRSAVSPIESATQFAGDRG
jgi:hypothetical protein